VVSEASCLSKPGDSELVEDLINVQIYLRVMGAVFPIAPEASIATLAKVIEALRKGSCISVCGNKVGGEPVI